MSVREALKQLSIPGYPGQPYLLLSLPDLPKSLKQAWQRLIVFLSWVWPCDASAGTLRLASSRQRKRMKGTLSQQLTA